MPLRDSLLLFVALRYDLLDCWWVYYQPRSCYVDLLRLRWCDLRYALI